MLTTAFTPSATTIAGSLPLTAIAALLPLAVFFIMLGVSKIATHWCAIGSLAIAIVTAAFGFHIPLELAALSAAQGAVFSLLIICYIVVAAVWLYNPSEVSGHGGDVRAVSSTVDKGDIHTQALLIATVFCALMEGLADFGTSIAITCTMLLVPGLKPLKAALTIMVTSSLHVALGAMAIPMIATTKLGGSEATLLTQTGSHITPFFLTWPPFVLLAVLGGKRGVRQFWPVALTVGIDMTVGYFVTARFISYELTAVVGALPAFILIAGLLSLWSPTTPEEERSVVATEKLEAGCITLALLPCWFIAVIFAVAKLREFGVDIPVALKMTDLKIPWPGLDGNLLTASGEVSKETILSISTFASPDTILVSASLAVTIVYSLSDSSGRFPFSINKGITTLGSTIMGLKMTILTISAVMALVYVMNFSGQTVAIGTALAGAGATFAFFAPILGWIGTAVTGSATSTGALFASLHSTVTTQTGLSSRLLLTADEIGGDIDKTINPQNLTIAATAVEEGSLEPELLHKAASYSVGSLLLLSIITVLASIEILGFLIAN